MVSELLRERLKTMEPLRCRVIRGSSERFPKSLLEEIEADGWHKITAEWITFKKLEADGSRVLDSNYWEAVFVQGAFNAAEWHLVEEFEAIADRELRLAIRHDVERSGIASVDNRFDFAAVHAINPNALPEHWLSVTEDFDFDLWCFMFAVLSEPERTPKREIALTVTQIVESYKDAMGRGRRDQQIRNLLNSSGCSPLAGSKPQRFDKVCIDRALEPRGLFYALGKKN